MLGLNVGTNKRLSLDAQSKVKHFKMCNACVVNCCLFIVLLLFAK